MHIDAAGIGCRSIHHKKIRKPVARLERTRWLCFLQPAAMAKCAKIQVLLTRKFGWVNDEFSSGVLRICGLKLHMLRCRSMAFFAIHTVDDIAFMEGLGFFS